MNPTTTPQLTNGREIAPGHPAVAPPARGGRIYTLQDVEIMARHAAASRMFGMDAAQACTLMLIAQSEGLDPIQALRRYHVIQGKPSMRADAMLAEFQRQGGTIEWCRATDEVCSAIFRHPVQAPEGVTVAFTMADARRANLDKKEVWRAYPGAMLRARVISSGVRMVLPGVVVGVYTPEEIGDWIHEPRPRPRARSLPPDQPEGDEDDFPRPARPWSSPPGRPAPPRPAPPPPPEPEPEPDPDPDPEPDDVAAAPPEAMSELRRFIRGEIAAAEERFREGLASAGAALPDHIELTNEFRVANSLVSRWIRDGLMEESDVAAPGGTRDRRRVGAALTFAYADQPEDVRAEVRDYLDAKLRKAYEGHGVRPPGSDRDEGRGMRDEGKAPPASGSSLIPHRSSLDRSMPPGDRDEAQAAADEDPPAAEEVP